MRFCALLLLVAFSVSSSEFVTDGNFTQGIEKGTTVVDFTAKWCGHCREIDPMIDEAAASYAGKVKVVKMDISESPKTYKQYGVMELPCLALFKDGKLVKMRTGPMSREALDNWVGISVVRAEIVELPPTNRGVVIYNGRKAYADTMRNGVTVEYVTPEPMASIREATAAISEPTVKAEIIELPATARDLIKAEIIELPQGSRICGNEARGVVIYNGRKAYADTMDDGVVVEYVLKAEIVEVPDRQHREVIIFDGRQVYKDSYKSGNIEYVPDDHKPPSSKPVGYSTPPFGGYPVNYNVTCTTG